MKLVFSTGDCWSFNQSLSVVNYFLQIQTCHRVHLNFFYSEWRAEGMVYLWFTYGLPICRPVGIRRSNRVRSVAVDGGLHRLVLLFGVDAWPGWFWIFAKFFAHFIPQLS